LVGSSLKVVYLVSLLKVVWLTMLVGFFYLLLLTVLKCLAQSTKRIHYLGCGISTI
jgi:hypothetical protein